MSYRLLVDSTEFWQALCLDLASARERILVQALTFEGDAAGRALTEALLASSAPDRRIVIDCFSKHVVSDCWLSHPRHSFNRPLHEERRQTDVLTERLEHDGVGVKFVNPFGAFYQHLAARNHKKLMVVDDRVAYIGGINFSDHNFAWHDLMIRIERPDVVAFLAEDFEATWSGHNLARTGRFGDLDLRTLDGPTNEDAFAPVLELLAYARKTIFVESPYFMEPFQGALSEAAQRGVDVDFVTPAENNWALLGRALAWRGRGDTVRVRHYTPRMTHMKAILVDDEALVLGSANFDLMSYRFQQEYLAIFRDPGLLADFRLRVVEPDLARSVRAATTTSGYRDLAAHWQIAGLERMAAAVKGMSSRMRVSPHFMRFSGPPTRAGMERAEAGVARLLCCQPRSG